MNDNTGYAAFVMYTALKLHFTSKSYDYIRYNGKVSASKDSFLKRKDKHTFYRLSRKYDQDELLYYYVSNFLEKPVKWVGDLTNDESEEIYKNWKMRNQSLTYGFKNDMIHLLDMVDHPKDIFSVVSGGYPILLQEAIGGYLMVETICILNDIMNFFPTWQKKISDDVVWPIWENRYRKYTPFIEYDKKKFKSIIKELIDDKAKN